MTLITRKLQSVTTVLSLAIFWTVASAESEQIDELDKNKTYLVYCKVGGRSGMAMDLMGELGFQKIYNIFLGK